jgi:acetyl esterase/lipase
MVMTQAQARRMATALALIAAIGGVETTRAAQQSAAPPAAPPGQGRAGGPNAQPAPPQDPQTIPLWNGPAPGALGSEPRDIPKLTIYMPRRTNTPLTAVVLAPGGGYVNLAMNHEGRQVANYFNSIGIATFVLEYRLGPRYRHPVPLGDIQRAIRTVRARAAEWRVAPDRVGVMGFSAGGHLAATASTMFDEGNAAAPDPIDRESSRPDFAILGYPVISMSESWTHQGSKNALLGPDADAALARSLSLDTRVTAKTPQTFVFHTNADTLVPVENSLTYFAALRKAGVPAELHVYRNGPHGVGLAMDDAALSTWPTVLANWMKAAGLRP